MDSHSGKAVLPPPFLWPWSLETKYPLLGHKLFESPPLAPSSTAFLPLCCACSAPEWSERKSRSRLQRKAETERGLQRLSHIHACVFLSLTKHKKDLLSLTDPSMPKRMLSLFMSLWITWLECKKSSAWRHYEDRKKRFKGNRCIFLRVWLNHRYAAGVSADV